MKQYYESEVLFQLMERDGFNIPSSVPPYEAEIKAYLINQVKQAYPKLTDYEAEWLLYNYTKHLPAEFPISSVSDVTEATFENVVPFAYQSAILKGSTKYRDIDTGDILDTFDETKNLELVSVKVPVLTTTGKNLFNMNKAIDAYLDTAGGIITPVDAYNKLSDYIEIKPNTTYVYSHGGFTIPENSKLKTPWTRYYTYDENKTKLTNGTQTSESFSLTTPTNAKYIRIGSRFLGLEGAYAQIEEGSTATTYEPYKSNILTVNEPVELRGIGDVQDTLDCLTGEVVERIKEIVFNGSEDWIQNGQHDNGSYRHMCNTYADAKSSSDYVICDKLGFADVNFTTGAGMTSDINIVKTTSTGKMQIATTKTLDELKAWLAQNPIAIQYELATESIKTVDLTTVNEKGETTYFMPLEGTMYVQSSEEIIQPTFDMSVPVEATTQNLASFIDLEMGNNHE